MPEPTDEAAPVVRTAARALGLTLIEGRETSLAGELAALRQRGERVRNGLVPADEAGRLDLRPQR